jgi:hypothetical protein
MFQLRIAKNDELSDLQKAISSLHARLDVLQPETKEYAAVADQLVKLVTLQDASTSKKRPSPDALVAGGASVLGILLIVAYEHGHVMTSKALSLVHTATR